MGSIQHSDSCRNMRVPQIGILVAFIFILVSIDFGRGERKICRKGMVWSVTAKKCIKTFGKSEDEEHQEDISMTVDKDQQNIRNRRAIKIPQDKRCRAGYVWSVRAR